MKHNRFYLVFSFFLWMPAIATTQNIMTPSQWEKQVASSAALQKEAIKADSQSSGNNSRKYYDLAYIIDGNTSMFQATGNKLYLDRALSYINNMINSARVSSSIPTSQFKDHYLGWVGFDQTMLSEEYPLEESFCWRYVTKLLRTMNNSPELLADKRYANQYQKILKFTENNIFDKWYTRGANKYVFRANAHMQSHWARIGMDLWLITKDPKYLEVFKAFNKNLEGQIKPNPKNPSAYFWNANWHNFSAPGQDVNHGNAVVGEIVEAYDAHLAYTKTDITSLINLLNTVIWPAKDVYAANFDGSGKGAGWFSDGFIKLGRYDQTLQLRLEKLKVGRTIQFYGNNALNACILLNGKPVYP